MLTPFHIEKAIQATAALLRTSRTARMTRLRVLKLLYIVERELLKETGRTITGDRAVAMDHGPVLTAVYNLIKGQHADASTWDKFIAREDEHDIKLVDDPGIEKLSRHELTKLEEVSKRFDTWSEWELVEHTHTFEEWINNKPPKGSRNKIPLDDILAALKMSAIKKELQQEAASLARVHSLLSS